MITRQEITSILPCLLLRAVWKAEIPANQGVLHITRRRTKVEEVCSGLLCFEAMKTTKLPG